MQHQCLLQSLSLTRCNIALERYNQQRQRCVATSHVFWQYCQAGHVRVRCNVVPASIHLKKGVSQCFFPCCSSCMIMLPGSSNKKRSDEGSLCPEPCKLLSSSHFGLRCGFAIHWFLAQLLLAWQARPLCFQTADMCNCVEPQL